MNAIVKYDGKSVTFCDTNPDDYLEQLLIGGCWYELPNLEFIRSLQHKGNYVDVGAYVGTHSLFFSMFCPASRVYSFEPQLKMYQKLVRNIAVNGVANCEAFNVALSDAPGKGIVGGDYCGARLVEGSDVEVITLDSLALPNITLMKVDVENSELNVLKGAKETLKSVEHLFVEMWHEPICKTYGVDYNYPQIVQFLKPYGLHLQKELPYEDLYYFSREKTVQHAF